MCCLLSFSAFRGIFIHIYKFPWMPYDDREHSHTHTHLFLIEDFSLMHLNSFLVFRMFVVFTWKILSIGMPGFKSYDSSESDYIWNMKIITENLVWKSCWNLNPSERKRTATNNESTNVKTKTLSVKCRLSLSRFALIA